jgi:hypothetical protein
VAWAVFFRAIESGSVDNPSIGTRIEHGMSHQAAQANSSIVSSIFHLWIGTSIRGNEALDHFPI